MKKGFISISIVYSFVIIFLLLALSIVTSNLNKVKLLDYITGKAKEELGSSVVPSEPDTIVGDASSTYRFLRDYANGSTANLNNHWVEIQVFDIDGINVSAGKTVTGLVDSHASYSAYSIITDGITTSSPYSASSSQGLRYVEIDLGAEYEISRVIVWHYYSDGRTYNDTKTELYNADRTVKYVIFNSAGSGKYAETATGNIIELQ